MTQDEWVQLYLLRAISQHGPVPVSRLVYAVRVQAGDAGLLPPGQIATIDDVLVGRALMDWGRAQPPLVEFDYDPADVLPHRNIRSGGERQWMLTDAGDAELRRLERLAGVVE